MIKKVEKRKEQLKNLNGSLEKITNRLSELGNFKVTKRYGKINKENNIDLVIFEENETVVFENWYLLAIYVEVMHYRDVKEEDQEKLINLTYSLYMEDKNEYTLQEIINFLDDRYQTYFKEKTQIEDILNEFYEFKENEYL